MKVLEFCKSEYECDDGGCCVIGALCRDAKIKILKKYNGISINSMNLRTIYDSLKNKYNLTDHQILRLQHLNDQDLWDELSLLLQALNMYEIVKKYGQMMKV